MPLDKQKDEEFYQRRYSATTPLMSENDKNPPESKQNYNTHCNEEDFVPQVLKTKLEVDPTTEIKVSPKIRYRLGVMSYFGSFLSLWMIACGLFYSIMIYLGYVKCPILYEFRSSPSNAIDEFSLYYLITFALVTILGVFGLIM